MSAQQVSVGRTVHYRLSAQDIEQISRRRTSGPAIADRIAVGQWPLGAQAHIGNNPTEGDVLPLIVTRVWSPGCVNGQVLLDGNDVLWVTSKIEGDQSGQWSWPPRA